jgi:hypothetical protein
MYKLTDYINGKLPVIIMHSLDRSSEFQLNSTNVLGWFKILDIHQSYYDEIYDFVMKFAAKVTSRWIAIIMQRFAGRLNVTTDD